LSAISGATQDLAAVSEEQAASSEEIATAVRTSRRGGCSAASSSETVRGQVAEVAASASGWRRSVDLAGLSAELQKLVGFFRLERDGERRGLVAVEKR
jgi:methyl-accepting chemotaxis protein